MKMESGSMMIMETRYGTFFERVFKETIHML